ncbi:hypothetical protein cypCar_00016400 [Cyprinus carpio]|nr:hypothetical protein cypCar_00016400 [Cyprinus carpio]
MLAQQDSMAFRKCVQVLLRSSLAPLCHPGSTRTHPRFLHTVLRLCSQSQPNGSSGSKVLVHFVNQSGVKSSVFVTEGETLLDVVIKKNLDISGFVVDDEVDMLDLAYGLTKTSRLGCQVTVERWMDGMTVHVPQEIKDQRGKQEAVSSK